MLVSRKSYNGIKELVDEVIDSLGIIEMEDGYRKIIYEIFSMSRYNTNFLLRTFVRTEPITNQERTFYTDNKGYCHAVVRYSIGYNVILNKPLDDDASLIIEEVNNDGEVTLTLKFKVKIKDQ